MNLLKEKDMKRVLLPFIIMCACICSCASNIKLNNIDNKEPKVVGRYENVIYAIDKETSELSIQCFDYVYKTYDYAIIRQVYWNTSVRNVFFERDNCSDLLFIFQSQL